MMDILSARGMVFAWYKDLAKYVDMPGEVMDKEIIEYHGRLDGRPILRSGSCRTKKSSMRKR